MITILCAFRKAEGTLFKTLKVSYCALGMPKDEMEFNSSVLKTEILQVLSSEFEPVSHVRRYGEPRMVGTCTMDGWIAS